MSGIWLTKDKLGPGLKLDESDRMRAHLIQSAVFPFSGAGRGGAGRGGEGRAGVVVWGGQVRAEPSSTRSTGTVKV